MRWPPLLAAAILSTLGCAPGSPRLNGGGSSFVYPVMLKWSRVYAAEHGLQVDYQSTGSGNGILQMTLGTVDFGCTDAPLNEEQLEKARGINGAVVHIPLCMGGVVPVYHLPGLPANTQLYFDGPALAGIFLGTITTWNDPLLVKLNRGVALPAEKIIVISRSDPSGTTAIFASYVAAVGKDLWAERDMAKPGTSTRWPVGEAQKGNEGVAGLVRRVPGSIGYVELKYALDVGLEFGPVQNRTGKFVKASPESVTAAARGVLATSPADIMRLSLIDAPGEDAYPISGTVWCVFYEDMPAARADRLAPFLRWATDPNRGARYAQELGYAPLPGPVVAAVRKKIDSLTGAP